MKSNIPPTKRRTGTMKTRRNIEISSVWFYVAILAAAAIALAEPFLKALE